LRPILIAIALSVLVLMTGCNVGGVVGYIATGPAVQPAQYKPDPKPTLVLVENYQSPSSVALDADRFAENLSNELRANTNLPLVDRSPLYSLRERDPSAYARLKVSEIAQKVGAEQVVYVDLSACQVQQSATHSARGRMAMRIKVIDAATGRTLWPVDAADGLPIVHETPLTQVSDTYRPEMLRTEMLQDVAARTARLFYDWKPVDLNEAADGTL
jgi:hypothetical protein